jgi:hypothetical protein
VREAVVEMERRYGKVRAVLVCACLRGPGGEEGCIAAGS